VATRSRTSEHAEQVALFQWAHHQRGRHPELDLLFAIPNGGARHPAVAGKLKAEGVKRGVPDLFLPVPRGGHHGLFIELKVGPNKPTPDQEGWLESLTLQGYAVCVCWGWEAATESIGEYLRLG